MPEKASMTAHAAGLAWPVRIDVGDSAIVGDLAVPAGARGLVIFAHGSGSSRHSSRNRSVAEALGKAQLATLLLDLLTEEEERVDQVTSELRFDIPLLTRRVTGAIDWTARQKALADLHIGLFGASTGAAAALTAATARPRTVRAIVSRGGRPDLAEASLDVVTAPTLLIVGERDSQVIDLNRQALDRLTTTRRLEIVPGATHLFEEAGALDAVARLAAGWFLQYLFWSADT